MTYIPHIPNNIPYLKVPENRVNLAFDWYSKKIEHPVNFACYSYWINQCKPDGSDY
jgi:hypothetical protein